MSEERNLSVEDIQNIENVIGYTFKNKKIIEQAFTRRSYKNEHWEEADNEVLEFYGDRALDITVTSYLSKRLGCFDNEGRFISAKTPNDFEVVDEGYLTSLRSYLVCRSTLAKKITTLGLMKYLRTGASDNSAVDSIKEDLFEAICGAIAIDANWDFNIVVSVISKFYELEDTVKEIIKGPDYVQIISEWHYRKFHRPIEVWNDEYLARTDWYEVRIYIDPEGQNMEFIGQGSTSLEAKNNALLSAYRDLFDDGQRFIYYPDDILEIFKPGWLEPNLDNSINIVQEMMQSKLLEKIQYEFNQKGNNENGNPLWECKASYKFDDKNYGYCTVAVGESKAEVKKRAALSVIDVVFEKYHYSKDINS